jgi:hypothetical protein
VGGGGVVWIFSGTTQCALLYYFTLSITSDNFTRQEENLPLNGLIRLSAYRMHPVYPVGGNVPRCALLYYFTLSYAWRCYSSGESAWIQYMHYKKLSDNENINLKMPRFLWQGNLPNRASKIKRLLARHEFHLPRASVKLHFCLRCINLVPRAFPFLSLGRREKALAPGGHMTFNTQI